MYEHFKMCHTLVFILSLFYLFRCKCLHNSSTSTAALTELDTSLSIGISFVAFPLHITVSTQLALQLFHEAKTGSCLVPVTRYI